MRNWVEIGGSVCRRSSICGSWTSAAASAPALHTPEMFRAVRLRKAPVNLTSPGVARIKCASPFLRGPYSPAAKAMFCFTVKSGVQNEVLRHVATAGDGSRRKGARLTQHPDFGAA